MDINYIDEMPDEVTINAVQDIINGTDTKELVTSEEIAAKCTAAILKAIKDPGKMEAIIFDGVSEDDSPFDAFISMMSKIKLIELTTLNSMIEVLEEEKYEDITKALKDVSGTIIKIALFTVNECGYNIEKILKTFPEIDPNLAQLLKKPDVKLSSEVSAKIMDDTLKELSRRMEEKKA